MAALPNLSLVEGAFEELALELAVYLDGMKGESSTLAADITPQLADPEKEGRPQETDKDAVLKKLVTNSSVLNNAAEKELQAAYNLLIPRFAIRRPRDLPPAHLQVPHPAHHFLARKRHWNRARNLGNDLQHHPAR